ncbi:uncharacterized protein LOC141669605 isoform X2 [Apium graveolens]|uniref:uncharacterized protein LOC141669605 isoform X2 n=1 Tax=Apium graveolens TaxID=4045 RepID=UPI003D7A2F42
MLPCSLWVSTRRNTHQTFTLFLMLVALPTALLPLQRLRGKMLQADDRVEAIPKGSDHYGTKGKLPPEMMEPRVQENVMLGKKAIDPYDLAEKNACLPLELRCLICTKYMKEAVIIPCCHQSFCERCIREVLTQKSKCPKCSSDKFKAEDVLPNLSLRETIMHLLEAQIQFSIPESVLRRYVPDEESVIQGWKRRLLTIKLKPLLRRSLRETSRESWVRPKMMWFPQTLFVTAGQASLMPKLELL